MDFRQLSPQIGTQPAGGELKAFGGGSPLGSPSHERGFSTVLQAVSHTTDVRREAKARAVQAEGEDRSSATTPEVQRGLSRKTDGSQERKPRVSQSETEDRPSSTMPEVHRSLPHKSDGGMEAESHPSQPETDDGAATSMPDVPAVVSHETSYGADAEPRAAEAETGDELSTTTSTHESLLLSLLGAAMVAPAPTTASTQEVAGSEISTSEAEGLSVFSGTPTIQPIAQPAEGIASLVPSESGRGDLAGQNTTSATGDTVALLSSPMPEGQPGSAGTDRVIPEVEKPDIGQPLTTLQSQEAQSHDSEQTVSMMGQPEEGTSPASVASGEDGARPAAPVTTQPTRQNGEGIAVQPDRLPPQQILGKGEPSLHQKNIPAESSVTQPAAAVSGHMPAEGQGANSESDGQRKDEGLKWFSRADLQPVEVSSRMPQPSTTEPVDGGRQYVSFQQSPGGMPSNSPPAATSPAPSSVQTSPLSPDPATAPVPRTHTVQFDLAPADFGQLRIRVVLSDHTIHTHLSTDRAELGQMLTGQQGQLSTQLSAAGLDLGRFHVQVDQERTDHSGQDWPSQAHHGTAQQQRDPRQQDRPQDVPAPPQKRSGVLSLFA